MWMSWPRTLYSTVFSIHWHPCLNQLQIKIFLIPFLLYFTFNSWHFLSHLCLLSTTIHFTNSCNLKKNFIVLFTIIILCNAQIALNLTNGSPFKLTPVSLWHVLFVFHHFPCFMAQENVSSFPGIFPASELVPPRNSDCF